jgi:phosphatidylglycerophosphate synthase
MEELHLLQWLGYLAVGGLIAIAIIYMPKRLLLKLGHFTTPNLISIIHVPIVWLGFYIYELDLVLLGLSVVAFGAMLDRLDGRLAKVFDVEIARQLLSPEVFDEVLKTKQFDSTLKAAIAKRVAANGFVRVIIEGKIFHITIPQTFRQAIWHPGGSELGKVIDPAMDKAAVLPIYMWIAYCWITGMTHDPLYYLYIFGSVIMGLILLTDLSGTVIRMDYFKRKDWIKSKGATWAGKVKALAQWLWLLVYLIQDQHMLPSYKISIPAILDFLLIGIFTLGVISLVSKMFPVKEEWIQVFKHDGE